MPCFSLKSLLLSTALISIGAGMISFVVHNWLKVEMPMLLLLCWVGGGALIGAGALTPLRQWFIGAVLGVAIQIWLLNFAASH